MKRLFPILLLAVAGLSCSDRRPEFVIGVSQCSDDEWREKMNLEMVRESRFYPGTEVVILSAHDDNAQQIQDIESLAAKGVDLLVVAPNEARAIAPAVEKVFDEGIPVVLVDRKTDSDKYTAYIGADNYEIGQAIGKYAGGRLHGKGKIVELTGLRASTPARERHEGFSDGISGFPDVEVVSSADAGWSGPSAAAVFDSILAVTPDIDMVVSHNDRMALGAYDAARRAGRAGNMLFVGVDALTAPGLGVEKVLDGTLDATFIYPTGGDKVIQVAMSILKDRPYERETLLSTALVDGSNARIMQMQTAHINALDEKIEYLNTRLGNSMVRFYSYRIYLIVCVGLLVLVAALMLFLVRERNRLKEQGKELVRQRDQSLELSRKLEEATRSKLAFFTNVAHDFRTPLTLIADPVDRLRDEKDRFNEHDRYLLDMVHKNVTLLLRLVNQILDFRKYESGKLSLNLSDFDAVAAVKDWAEVFRPLSYRKHVRFDVDACPSVGEGTIHVHADAEKMERIVYNLLANAFKFTPENGSVSLSLATESGSDAGGGILVIRVTDTGVGISEEHIRHIFENFYQADVHHSGSGIGLALAKGFVEMHGGTVSVESTEGKGTVFTVRMPVCLPEGERSVPENPVKDSDGRMTVFREGAVADADQETVLHAGPGRAHDAATDAGPESAGGGTRQTVLVIDDNKDVRDYVRSLLEGQYNILEAADGKDGLRIAMKYVPDAVICDVMMPVMDGMECCRRLKSELQTSHIPVMMLTAYAVDEQKIKGYECGADSYISKPFSARLLMVRLHNILENRDRLRSFFTDGTAVQKSAVSDIDKGFAGKLKSIIDAHLSDADFSVESLGESIGLSRVQLYRKTKSLTGYSPVELLRITRLKKAASILSSSDRTVAEVAYETGFNSPSYFTKCYKEYFGENPTDLVKRKR